MRPSSKTATKATGARAIAHRRPVDAVTTTPTARATIIVTIACEVVTGPRGVRYALPSANASTLAMASIVVAIPRFLVAIPLPPTADAERPDRRGATPVNRSGYSPRAAGDSAGCPGVGGAARVSRAGRAGLDATLRRSFAEP